MITEVKVRKVRVPSVGGKSFEATVEDGEIRNWECPLESRYLLTVEILRDYIKYLEEVIEAIRETAP